MATVTRFQYTPPLDPIAKATMHRTARASYLESNTPPVSLPVVDNVVPAPGTIASNQPLAFHVTSPAARAFTSVTVLISFPLAGIYEVLYDGSAFGPNYAGSIASILHGFAFSGVLRTGGWPAPFSLTVNAIDTAGQENS